MGKKTSVSSKIKSKGKASLKRNGSELKKKSLSTSKVTRRPLNKKPHKKLKTAGTSVKRARTEESEEQPQSKKAKYVKLKPKVFISKSMINKKTKSKAVSKEKVLKPEGSINNAKSIWEKLRRHNLSDNERKQLIIKLMDIIRPDIYKLALKHDTARIVQCVLKFGSLETRNEIFEILKDHIVDLSKRKYSKFIVKSLLIHGMSKQRKQLISVLHGHVKGLVKHKEAVDLVELVYNEYATAKERALLLQEFYGPQFTLFEDSSGLTIEQILSTCPEQKEALIRHMKQTLLNVLNKGLHKPTIIHKALLEFFLHADDSSKAEIIEILREKAVEILHTREGVKVALHCLWHGTSKDRKVLVKSFKGFVSKICKEEHGHLAMLGIFDCVDDTVLVRKALLSEVTDCLEELCEDKFGRRVLLYLLSPRCPQHFNHQFVSLLTPGDSNKHSKKPQDVRWTELREGISPQLIELASRKAVLWARENSISQLLLQIVYSATGDVSPIYGALCKALSEQFSDEHLVTDGCGHLTIKRLLKANSNDIVVAFLVSTLFADVIIRSVPLERLNEWVTTNRGCFVLSSLIEQSQEHKGMLIESLRQCVPRMTASEGCKVLLKIMNCD